MDLPIRRNTIKASIERYESENPKPDCKLQDRAFIAWYRGLLLEIGKQAGQMKIKDLTELDYLFREIYLPLTLKNGVLPKIIDFCSMLHLNPDTLSNIKPGTQGYDIYCSWLNICKQYVLANLSDEPGSNVNLIFVAKSTFGITDSPNANENKSRITAKSREEVLKELSTLDNTQIE